MVTEIDNLGRINLSRSADSPRRRAAQWRLRGWWRRAVARVRVAPVVIVVAVLRAAIVPGATVVAIAVVTVVVIVARAVMTAVSSRPWPARTASPAFLGPGLRWLQPQRPAPGWLRVASAVAACRPAARAAVGPVAPAALTRMRLLCLPRRRAAASVASAPTTTTNSLRPASKHQEGQQPRGRCPSCRLRPTQYAGSPRAPVYDGVSANR